MRKLLFPLLVAFGAFFAGGANAWDTKFSITTTNLDADTTGLNFVFSMSAKGEFYVDCGDDGTLSGTGAIGDTITRTGTVAALYTCTYTTGGIKTIQIGGLATGYSIGIQTSAIQFGSSASSSTLTPTLVAGISGSLGAIFPSLGNDNGKQPRFYQTFYNCSNMTGSIPSGLFTGISGQPATYMFSYTFYNCSGLTGSIPSGLFGNLSGSAANSMFRETFSQCSGLTGSIPAGLFGNLTGVPTQYMFNATFKNCSGLTGSIPAGLFGNLTGQPASGMFQSTFDGCSGLNGSIK